MKIKVAPSVLSANFGRLNEEVASVEPYSDLIHVDVMDGHFVSNITIGAPIVKCIETELPLDVHLMIESPEDYIEDFVKAGADYITVHFEACKDVKSALKMIQRYGIGVGISVKPETKVQILKPYLHLLDLILIMSVEPGFGGQKFMSSALGKIKWLREQGFKGEISVDGGINAETGSMCARAGASILVAGNYIFGAKNRAKACEALRG